MLLALEVRTETRGYFCKRIGEVVDGLEKVVRCMNIGNDECSIFLDLEAKQQVSIRIKTPGPHLLSNHVSLGTSHSYVLHKVLECY